MSTTRSVSVKGTYFDVEFSMEECGYDSRGGDIFTPCIEKIMLEGHDITEWANEDLSKALEKAIGELPRGEEP